MKAASISEIKRELALLSSEELIHLCLRLTRFKAENKELLTYLLYEASDESGYIRSVKEALDMLFEEINTTSPYFVKKSVRKILRQAKKFIRYSGQKQTEVELLLHICHRMGQIQPSIQTNSVLRNLYFRQVATIKKAIQSLPEDLQYDYNLELSEVTG